jgi:hypothetical protein
MMTPRIVHLSWPALAMWKTGRTLGDWAWRALGWLRRLLESVMLPLVVHLHQYGAGYTHRERYQPCRVSDADIDAETVSEARCEASDRI